MVKASRSPARKAARSPVTTKVESLFDSIIHSEIGEPRVSPGTGFGTNKGLRVSGKIYAFLSNGELVVKLPEERVGSLMGSGLGKPFSAGKQGRVMREWVAVPASASRRWRALVEEAREFVSRP
jgi:hypothetical protein